MEGEWPATDPAAGNETPDPEARLDIRRAVADLPASYQVPVIMRYQEGLSYAEIAEALGVEPNAASMRVHRAKNMLRKRLRHLWSPE